MPLNHTLLHLCCVVSEAQHQLQSPSPTKDFTALSSLARIVSWKKGFSECNSCLRRGGIRTTPQALKSTNDKKSSPVITKKGNNAMEPGDVRLLVLSYARLRLGRRGSVFRGEASSSGRWRRVVEAVRYVAGICHKSFCLAGQHVKDLSGIRSIMCYWLSCRRA